MLQAARHQARVNICSLSGKAGTVVGSVPAFPDPAFTPWMQNRIAIYIELRGIGIVRTALADNLAHCCGFVPECRAILLPACVAKNTVGRGVLRTPSLGAAGSPVFMAERGQGHAFQGEKRPPRLPCRWFNSLTPQIGDKVVCFVCQKRGGQAKSIFPFADLLRRRG